MFDNFATADPIFWLWAVANLATGVAYIGIPIELWTWYRTVKFHSIGPLILIFIAFILTNAVHHLRLPFSGQGGHVSGWGAGLDMIMAVTSVTAHMLLAEHRRSVIRAIRLAQQEKEMRA